MRRGKWYWEILTVNAANLMIGIMNSSGALTSFPGSDTNGYGYYSVDGNKYTNSGAVAYGNSYCRD